MASIAGVSVMAALLAAAGLDAALGGQPATVFAPTDAALLGGAVAGGLTLAAVAGAERKRTLADFVRCAITTTACRRQE